MKKLLVFLAAAVIGTLVLTSRSRLEKDAEYLANAISTRQTCGLTPVYQGYDGVAGRYDFDRVDRQKFQSAYDHYFSEAESRVFEMSPEERTLMCRDALRSE